MATNNPTGVRELALSVLNKKWDNTWDKNGTSAENLSQAQKPRGTGKTQSIHEFNPLVPVSQTLGTGTVGQTQKSGTRLGTRMGQGDQFPFAGALDELERRCPAYIEPARWQQCVIDAQRFIAAWGDKAMAFGWTAEELFGLHTPPANPHPSYHRLSRYDCTGLIWHLVGHRVVALTADAAAIQNPTTGNVLVYRKYNKPGLGPLGDSLDDFK